MRDGAPIVEAEQPAPRAVEEGNGDAKAAPAALLLGIQGQAGNQATAQLVARRKTLAARAAAHLQGGDEEVEADADEAEAEAKDARTEKAAGATGAPGAPPGTGGDGGGGEPAADPSQAGGTGTFFTALLQFVEGTAQNIVTALGGGAASAPGAAGPAAAAKPGGGTPPPAPPVPGAVIAPKGTAGAAPPAAPATTSTSTAPPAPLGPTTTGTPPPAPPGPTTAGTPPPAPPGPTVDGTPPPAPPGLAGTTPPAPPAPSTVAGTPPPAAPPAPTTTGTSAPPGAPPAPATTMGMAPPAPPTTTSTPPPAPPSTATLTTPPPAPAAMTSGPTVPPAPPLKDPDLPPPPPAPMAATAVGTPPPGPPPVKPRPKPPPQRPAPPGIAAPPGPVPAKPKARKKGGGGGAPKPPPKPPLGDPTLAKWKTTVDGQTGAIAHPDLADAKLMPAQLAGTAEEQDAARRAAMPDFEADAKAKQPKDPEPPQREEVLDTTEARAAVAGVEAAGQVRLPDATFPAVQEVPLGTLNVGYVTAADYVPKAPPGAPEVFTRSDGPSQATDGKPVRTDAKADEVPGKVAEVDKKAGEGTPQPVTISDPGAAPLTPLPPDMAGQIEDVLARVLKDVGKHATKVTEDAAKKATNGKPFEKMKTTAAAHASEVSKDMSTELKGIATSASGSEKGLLDKVKALEEGAKATGDEVKTGIEGEGAKGKEKTQKRGDDAGKKIKGSKDNVDAEIEAKEQAANGGPDQATIDAKRDEFLGKLETSTAAAQAALRATKERRHKDVDDVARVQKQAYASGAQKVAAAVRRHWDGGETPDKTKAQVESRRVLDWGDKKQREVDAHAATLKKAADDVLDKASADLFVKSTAAKEQIRDWAAAKVGRVRSWWDRLLDMIRDWSSQAKASSTAWEQQRDAESRRNIVSDFDQLAKVRKLMEEGNQAAVEAELSRMDSAQRAIAMAYIQGGGQDAIGAIAVGTVQRLSARRVEELAPKLEDEALAKWEIEDLVKFARARDGVNVPEIASNIRGAIAQVGTDEKKVWDNLGLARTKLARQTLERYYKDKYEDSIRDDLEGDLSGSEERRAIAMLEGRQADATAESLYYAMEGGLTGIGTDEADIRDALRGKSKEEREAIAKAYKDKFGVELKDELKDEMEGGDLDAAEALMEGDEMTAIAAEIKAAMDGAGTDEAAITQTYERVRQEVEAEAARRGLSTAEMKVLLDERNAMVREAFNKKYGKEFKSDDPKKDALATAFGEELENADLDLAEASAKGDLQGIDAAKLRVEKESSYVSDDATEKVIRAQHERAKADWERDLAADQLYTKERYEAGDLTKEQYKSVADDLKKKGSKEYKEQREKEIKDKAKANMAGLEDRYNEMAKAHNAKVPPGSPPEYTHGDFDSLIEQDTGWVSGDEKMKKLVEEGGQLSDADEIHYAIDGAGTDNDRLKKTLEGKSKDEINEIRKKYEETHGKGSFDDDILSDLSGRDDFDIGLMLEMGEPQTPAERVAWAKKRAEYEKSGIWDNLGFDYMKLDKDVLELEDAAAEYAEAQKKFKPGDDEYEAAKAAFDMYTDSNKATIENNRAVVDSVTDTAVQIVTVPVALVVAGAIIFFSGGTATPALVAAASAWGAAAGAAAGMATKAALKGQAYSWEEAGVDLAVGIVDTATSYFTAGMGDKLLEAAVFKAMSSQMAKVVGKTGSTVLVKGVTEAVENAVGAVPSALAQAAADENTWKGGNPIYVFLEQAGNSAGMGIGAGIGMGAATKAGGRAAKPIVKALKDLKTKAPTPDVHVHTTPDPHAVPLGEIPDVPKGADPDTVVSQGMDDVKQKGLDRPAADGPGGKPGPDDPALNVGDEPGVKAGDEAKAGDEGGGAKAGEEPAAKAGDEAAEAKGRDEPDDGADDAVRSKAGAGEGDVTTGKVEALTEKDIIEMSVTDDELLAQHGMPKENTRKIKGYCEARGIVLDMRPTNPEAPRLLAEGTAIPKPMEIKAKTVTKEDIALGYPETMWGQVGFKDPKTLIEPKPENFADPNEFAKLKKRYDQRVQEYKDLKPTMDDMAKPVGAQGVGGGKRQIRIEPDGRVVDVSSGKGFTGDHDIFSLKWADGRPMFRWEYDAIVKDLIGLDAGVQHGAHIDWPRDVPNMSPKDIAGYEAIVAKHKAEGGERLIRFGEPDGSKVVWFEGTKELKTVTGVDGTQTEIPMWNQAGHPGRVEGPQPEGKEITPFDELPTPGRAKPTADAKSGAAEPDPTARTGSDADADAGAKGTGTDADPKLRSEAEAKGAGAEADPTSRVDPDGEPTVAKPASKEQVGDVEALAEGKGIDVAPPDPAAVAAAQANLAAGKASPGDEAALLAQVVSDFRTMQALEAKRAAPFHGAALQGACGMGRDFTLQDLASLAKDANGPVTMRRFQFKSVFGDVNAQHGFVVVTFPGGRSYIVDATFAQFVSGALGPKKTWHLADKMKGTESGAKLLADVMRDGFIPLTPANAAAYVKALHAEGQPVGDWKALLDAEHTLVPGKKSGLEEVTVGQGKGAPDTESILDGIDYFQHDDKASILEAIDTLWLPKALASGDPATIARVNDIRRRIAEGLPEPEAPVSGKPSEVAADDAPTGRRPAEEAKVVPAADDAPTLKRPGEAVVTAADDAPTLKRPGEATTVKAADDAPTLKRPDEAKTLKAEDATTLKAEDAKTVRVEDAATLKVEDAKTVRVDEAATLKNAGGTTGEAKTGITPAGAAPEGGLKGVPSATRELERFDAGHFTPDTSIELDGVTGAMLLTDPDGKRFLFKPADQEGRVDTTGMGIESGSFARRAVASEALAAALGFDTPHVRMAEIDGRVGSLQEWREGMTTIAAIEKADPARAAELRAREDFATAREDLRALDYVLGNSDRNAGNYLIGLGEGDQLQQMVPIDNDLTLPGQTPIGPRAPKMPTQMTPAFVAKLEALLANETALRKHFETALTPQELDLMIARAKELLAAQKGPGGGGAPPADGFGSDFEPTESVGGDKPGTELGPTVKRGGPPVTGAPPPEVGPADVPATDVGPTVKRGGGPEVTGAPPPEVGPLDAPPTDVGPTVKRPGGAAPITGIVPPPHVVPQAAAKVAAATEALVPRPPGLAPKAAHLPAVDAKPPSRFPTAREATDWLRSKWGQAKNDGTKIDIDLEGIGDGNLVTKLAKTLDDLLARYPAVAYRLKEFKLDDLGQGVEGEAHPKDHTLHLNPDDNKSWMERSASQIQQWTVSWKSTYQAEHVLAHEFGHHVHFLAETILRMEQANMGGALQGDALELRHWDRRGRAALAQKLSEMIEGMGGPAWGPGVEPSPAATAWLNTNLSRYGATNAAEVCAEAFSEWYLKGAKARPFAQAVGKWLDSMVAKVTT